MATFQVSATSMAGATSSNATDEMSAPTPNAMINPMTMRLRRNAKATSAATINDEAPTNPQNAASPTAQPPHRSMCFHIVAKMKVPVALP